MSNVPRFGCGPDGLPLDPDHPWNKPQANETRLDPIEHHLRNLERAYKRGVPLAAVEAMLICHDHRRSWPQWLQDAALEIALLQLSGGGRTSGRTGNVIARYREDLKHFTRWSVVDEIRDRQALEPDEFGKTKSEACALASQELRGTFAQGSPDTIEASYDLVNREGGNSRFMYLDRCARQFGLER